MNNTNAAILVSELSVPGKAVNKRKNQLITFSEDQPFCVLIHEGIVSVIRQNDGMLIKNYAAPMVVGLNFHKQSDNIYLRAATDLRVECLPLSEAEEKIEQNRLWKQTTLLCMQLMSNALEYHQTLVGGSARETIINAISHFVKEPLFTQERSILAEYIIDKTNLSRSSVMKTLAALKKEGRLETSRGFFISFK